MRSGGCGVGPAAGLRSLVLPGAPWCAVAFRDGRKKIPVYAFVSGCPAAGVAGGHLRK